jgi:RND family efflux transporter MFP subunit
VPTGCKKGGGAQQAGSETAQSVSTAEVISEDIERRIDITGTLAPWEEATISVEVDGRIVEVNVDLGDQVKKDDVLARIMPVEYEWKKTQAEADLSTAEADYKRLTQLIQNSVASKQQLDEAKRRLDVARATADLARKKFSDTVLRAPFHGSIAKRFINAGEYIRAGASAFYVVRVNPIKFKGDVPERYAGDVHRDDHVLAYTESSTLSLPGTIVRVGPSVASDSRSFPVEAEIDNSEGRIKPGSFARVSILTRKLQNMLTVPETAVFTFAGNTRVFVVKDNAAHERIIETSGKLRDRVLVVKGLSAGEKVVTTGVELLTDGKPVTLR